MSEDIIVPTQEPLTVVEFLNKMIGKQLLQYDTLFNAAIEKSELNLAFKVLTIRTNALREWVRLDRSEDI